MWKEFYFVRFCNLVKENFVESVCAALCVIWCVATAPFLFLEAAVSALCEEAVKYGPQQRRCRRVLKRLKAEAKVISAAGVPFRGWFHPGWLFLPMHDDLPFVKIVFPESVSEKRVRGVLQRADIELSSVRIGKFVLKEPYFPDRAPEFGKASVVLASDGIRWERALEIAARLCRDIETPLLVVDDDLFGKNKVWRVFLKK